MTSTEASTPVHPVELDQVVVRFAGDSGDGMQLTGSQFTRTTALMGNDIATFPDFPAEIRAPAGTLPGVSAFQLRFANFDIHTPGDRPDVLVAMNPAALKVHVNELKPGGLLILNTASFKAVDLKKAQYQADPREDGSLDSWRVVEVNLEEQTLRTLEKHELDNRSKLRCKNMFALGILYWLYQRKVEETEQAIRAKFAKKPEVAEANLAVLRAGHAFAETTELFQTRYTVAPASFQESGLYRNIMGNQALCLGLLAGVERAGLKMFLGSYPITPASDILHQLSTYKHMGVVTFQAEDEIAAVCSAIGASYAGMLGVTSTSGPGLALKGEAMGLAVMTELPLVVVNVQRAGPSTGMPTKTEQADLLQALYGRHGESPMAVVAASTPSDAFDAAFEAVRIAVEHMVPVILLSDGYIANGAEPWKVPDPDRLPEIKPRFAPASDGGPDEVFQPYERDPETLARAWAIPGTRGLHHRIGGLEKQDVTGNISYDPANHQHMTDTRAGKVERIAATLPPLQVLGEPEGDVLLVGWGGTKGALTAASLRLQREGEKVSMLCLRHLNPLPRDLGDVLKRFKKVVVAELNCGQLCMLLRARYLIPAESYSKVEGQPFNSEEVEARLRAALQEVKR